MANPGSYLAPSAPKKSSGASTGSKPMDQANTQSMPTGKPAPLSPWEPQSYQGNVQSPPPHTQAQHGGGLQDFWKGDPNIWNSNAYKTHDAQTPNYLERVLPVAQMNQNAYQWSNEFNEMGRRWDAEFGNTQTNDAFQRDLSARQQQMAEWQANTAAGQWDQQFGHTKYMDQQGLAQRAQELGLRGREIDNTGLYQQGLIGNQARLNDAQDAYWQGQNRNQAQEIANTGLYQQGILQNQGFANETERQNVQNQYAIAQQANSIDQAYKQGLISNEQRNLALQELTQQQNNQYLYAQMAQQAELAKARNQAEQEMAAMAAFGRRQAPSTSFARSWN